jgi:hypothetical protein
MVIHHTFAHFDWLSFFSWKTSIINFKRFNVALILTNVLFLNKFVPLNEKLTLCLTKEKLYE